MFRIHQGYILLVITLVAIVEVCNSRHSHHHNHHSYKPRHRNSDVDTKTKILDIDERMALEHSQRVAEAGECDEPKVHIIHVSDHYPGRYFLPHCTILHRCGKHAGCCGSDSLRCVAKSKEKVLLHFYSVRLGEDGEEPESKIEKLSFYNHTKCGCAPLQHVSKHDL